MAGPLAYRLDLRRSLTELARRGVNRERVKRAEDARRQTGGQPRALAGRAADLQVAADGGDAIDEAPQAGAGLTYLARAL